MWFLAAKVTEECSWCEPKLSVPGDRGSGQLTVLWQHLFNSLSFLNARQFLVQTTLKPSRPIVVQSHQPQNCGMKFPHVAAIHCCLRFQIVWFSK